MKRIQVITDSTSDVEKKFREEHGIDYVMMDFSIDEKDYEANLDWEKITPADYYGMMRNGKRSITNLVTAGQFEKKFTEYLEQGIDIIYVACSSKLSASINNAEIVANDLREKFPERKIVCFDSLRSNYAEGLIAVKAAELVEEGKEVEEIVDVLTEERLKYQTYATVGSLSWLKQAGRVKASKAFFGNLFGVKPIIVGDAIGANYAFMKAKGRQNSLDELVRLVKERIIDAENAVVYVEHADCLQAAEYVAAKLKEEVKVKDVNISSVGPIIGATVGPDTITVNFYGQKVEIIGNE